MGAYAAGECGLNRLATFGLALATLGLAMPCSASAGPQRRLPPGAKWGRCLLVVDGQTRISGKCSYTIYKSGEFHIDGPRQVFDGIDYPKAGNMAAMISKDYWADVFLEDGHWAGYGNDLVASVHGEGDWGVLQRKGACFVGRSVRICLWRA